MSLRILSILKSYINDPAHWLKNIIWRFPQTICEKEIVFVVGAPRSGTTLIQRVLASHNYLFSIEGESGLFSYQNIFDKDRHHFGFEDDVVKELFSKSKDIVDFFEKGIEKLQKNNEGKIFVEKTPQHILHLQFIRKYFPNAKVIHIVRDGRDCFCSSRDHRHIPQSRSVRAYAKYWKKCVSSPLKSLNYNELLLVKYEEFVRKPESVLKEIMKHLGLEFDEKQLEKSNYSNDQRAKMQEFKNLNQDVNDKSVGRYENELTIEELKTFNKVSGEYLEFYGYKVC